MKNGLDSMGSSESSLFYGLLKFLQETRWNVIWIILSLFYITVGLIIFFFFFDFVD